MNRIKQAERTKTKYAGKYNENLNGMLVVEKYYNANIINR